MQREIKFRAWDTIRKNWVYHQLYHDAYFDGEVYRSDFTEWMQCTGLKDENGKEIYEGDIVYRAVNDKDKLGVVTYMCDYAAFVSQPPNNPDVCTVLGHGHEVIGNIYENPELLSRH